MIYVRESADGIRLLAMIWAGSVATMIVISLSVNEFSGEWWLSLVVPFFVGVRSWQLGVFLMDDGIVIKSWFRVYRLMSAEIERIDLEVVYSALLGAGVGWFPFVGSVRMIKVDLVGKGALWFPATLGRRNKVLRVVRVLRDHVQAPRGGDITL